HELSGRCFHFQRQRAVQKPSLVSKFHRLAFVDRRNSNHSAQGLQVTNRFTQIVLSIPQVGPQREIRNMAHDCCSSVAPGRHGKAPEAKSMRTAISRADRGTDTLVTMREIKPSLESSP